MAAAQVHGVRAQTYVPARARVQGVRAQVSGGGSKAMVAGVRAQSVRTDGGKARVQGVRAQVPSGQRRAKVLGVRAQTENNFVQLVVLRNGVWKTCDEMVLRGGVWVQVSTGA